MPASSRFATARATNRLLVTERLTRGRQSPGVNALGQGDRATVAVRMAALGARGAGTTRKHRTGDARALTLRGVEIASWQGISLPRKWSDPDRKPDKSPDKQVLEMFKRLRLSLRAWVECFDHLVPSS